MDEFTFEEGRFLPLGYDYDSQHRVTKPCPDCGLTVFAPGPSGWTSRYWVHSFAGTYACPA